jgi:hypothetical protein
MSARKKRLAAGLGYAGALRLWVRWGVRIQPRTGTRTDASAGKVL